MPALRARLPEDNLHRAIKLHVRRSNMTRAAKLGIVLAQSLAAQTYFVDAPAIHYGKVEASRDGVSHHGSSTQDPLEGSCMPAKIIPDEYIGKRFGRLTITAFAKTRGGRSAWICVCDCSGTITAAHSNIMAGSTRSCGCVRKETAAATGRDKSFRHGGHGTAEYRAWNNLKCRCNNPNDKAYFQYGGRGITVCERWLNSFENFLADMGPRPGDGYSIDRYPDNDGNYEPANCRWATRKEQGRNKRNNNRIQVLGSSLALSEAAERTGRTYSSLWHRLKNGWPIDRAITTPEQHGHDKGWETRRGKSV